MEVVVLVLGVALSTLLLVVLTSAIVTVDDGEIRALMVSGEMRAVLEPGIHVVPPFVSATHPIDSDAETIEKENASVPVPAEFSAEFRDATEQ